MARTSVPTARAALWPLRGRSGDYEAPLRHQTKSRQSRAASRSYRVRGGVVDSERALAQSSPLPSALKTYLTEEAIADTSMRVTYLGNDRNPPRRLISTPISRMHRALGRPRRFEGPGPRGTVCGHRGVSAMCRPALSASTTASSCRTVDRFGCTTRRDRPITR